MSDLNVTLKAGTLLVIELGEYSDYTYDGPVRVVRDFVKADVVEAYRAAPPANDWSGPAEPGEFLAWLIKEGYVEALDDVHSWHVGSYGDFQP